MLLTADPLSLATVLFFQSTFSKISHGLSSNDDNIHILIRIIDFGGINAMNITKSKMMCMLYCITTIFQLPACLVKQMLPVKTINCYDQNRMTGYTENTHRSVVLSKCIFYKRSYSLCGPFFFSKMTDLKATRGKKDSYSHALSK